MNPRGVKYENGKFTWNELKITVNKFEKDQLMLKNVFGGQIISSDIYPLIYESESEIPEVSCRSLLFYQEVSKNAALYHNLNEQFKIVFAIGLRDLFVASQRNLLTATEQKLLKQVVNVINDDLLTLNINGLEISPYPSATRKVVKFLERNTIVDEEIKQYFVLTDTNHYLVFVDPAELSYHNFENIIVLDQYLKQSPLKFEIAGDVERIGNEIYKFQLTGTTDLLLALDKLGLYSIPLNKKSRGGQRFIFSSSLLSEALMQAITVDDFMDECQSINSVFRYNKFVPGDRKFISHYDTPYYDSEKSLRSKYTLIFYLTGGSNNPVLRVGDVELNEMEPFTCVIFDQKYEHEGNAYLDNEKIFLRTELIFFDATIKHDPEVAKLFNSACYMTKQSIFNKELSRYASDMFNHVAQLRYSLTPSTLLPLLILKMYQELPFITNGHDYYFAGLDLKSAAVVTVLDYFNGTLGQSKFNKLTQSKVINEIKDVDDILLYLNKMIEYREYKLDISEHNIGGEKLPVKKKFCCDFHCHGDEFDPRLCKEVIKRYNILCEKYKSDECSVAICDDQIKINLDDLEVTENQIRFKTTGTFPRINFAACWNSDNRPEDYITTKQATGFSLPPIHYRSTLAGHHLTIDMFNNDFILKNKCKIPSISDEPERKRDEDDEVDTRLLQLPTRNIDDIFRSMGPPVKLTYLSKM